MIRSKPPFEGRTAIVTGGGSGIGRAVALGLARDGAQVCIIGRDRARLDDTASAMDGAIAPFPCDIGDPDGVARTFGQIGQSHGPVDFLVNAAGLYPQAALAEFDMRQWRAAMDANLLGTALAIHHVLPAMLERDFGRIVMLGSRSAHGGGAVTSAYSASKAGVEALSRSVAHEILWRRKGRPDVHANVLYPGQTVTGLLDAPVRHARRYQRPEEVYPYVRALLMRPRWAGMGQVVYRTRIVSRGGWKLVAKQLRANLAGIARR